MDVWDNRHKISSSSVCPELLFYLYNKFFLKCLGHKPAKCIKPFFSPSPLLLSFFLSTFSFPLLPHLLLWGHADCLHYQPGSRLGDDERACACRLPEYASHLFECLSTPAGLPPPSDRALFVSFPATNGLSSPRGSHHHISQPLMAAADFTASPPAIFLMTWLSNMVTQSSKEPPPLSHSPLCESLCHTHFLNTTECWLVFTGYEDYYVSNHENLIVHISLFATNPLDRKKDVFWGSFICTCLR